MHWDEKVEYLQELARIEPDAQGLTGLMALIRQAILDKYVVLGWDRSQGVGAVRVGWGSTLVMVWYLRTGTATEITEVATGQQARVHVA